ncbi:MAG: DUF554 domain-containing protein [Lachnospiraceae bacterium]|nr:DUF554 domain-containing protein [Lachnospiraceae bacterium]
MPIGVITDASMVALGGLIGAALGPRLKDNIKTGLNQFFGFIALAIAITLVIKVNTLAVVALSAILGMLIGTILNMEDHVSNFFSGINKKFFSSSGLDDEKMAQFTTLLVLCCTSGTGIFGSMNEGLSGDSSVIITKAILDFFTVMIFATLLGSFTAIIAIPQIIILLVCFFAARLIMPLITPEMLANFSAVGGILELAIAFRILKLSSIKAVNIIPALILVFPLTSLWGIIF